MAIESFRLQKIYFTFLIDAIAKYFFFELSLFVCNRLPYSLHYSHDSFVLGIVWFRLQLTINLASGN